MLKGNTKIELTNIHTGKKPCEETHIGLVEILTAAFPEHINPLGVKLDGEIQVEFHGIGR